MQADGMGSKKNEGTKDEVWAMLKSSSIKAVVERMSQCLVESREVIAV
jgi:hypothetical protein